MLLCQKDKNNTYARAHNHALAQAYKKLVGKKFD